jgi:hypothetical protein
VKARSWDRISATSPSVRRRRRASARPGPADEDHAQRRRRAPQHIVHLAENLRIVDLMEVVEDQDRTLRQ